MRVVLDGVSSSETEVLSGVPQGTVLGPLLFLCHINDLPLSVKSQVRLFADDCLLYRAIRNVHDHILLQNDLLSLEKWATTWGMKFNAKKCYILSIKKKSDFYYQLDNTILKEVPNNPYLGITISNDLSWSTHIDNVCRKASCSLGFLRRNLSHCPMSTRKLSYVSLVRSTLEYGCSIWDPYHQNSIDKLERIQRGAARFITRDFKSRRPGCMTSMLQDLELQPLQDRRKELRLVLLYKIAEGLLPAIPPDPYLTPCRPKRKIRARAFGDYVASNPVTRHQRVNDRCFEVPQSSTKAYQNSFFVRTIVDWNQLDNNTVSASSPETFKVRKPLRTPLKIR